LRKKRKNGSVKPEQPKKLPECWTPENPEPKDLSVLKPKEAFQWLCGYIESCLAYKLAMSDEELELVNRYYRLKHETECSGGVAYKHAVGKLQELKEEIERRVL
jgi:hypothetical protein